MITQKLEKSVILYKTQYDSLSVKLFGSSLLDRISMDMDGMIFKTKYMLKHNLDIDKIPEIESQFGDKVIQMRECVVKILMSLLDSIDVDINKVEDVFVNDMKVDPIYVKFTLIVLSSDEELLENINEIIPEDKPWNIFPNEYFRFGTESYNDGIAKAYPELFEVKHLDDVGEGNDGDVFVHNVTLQTTEACSLNCTYCYQHNKTPMKMSFEIASKFIDNLLENKYAYVNQYNSPAIILEFIGGEPLLEIELTRKIYEYFLKRAYELNHPWFTMHRLSICSNGLSYFDKAVQDFFREYSSQISFNISIDGNKDLHDACRIQPNGEGSYDIAMMALNHYNKNYTPERNSKMTLSPQNISYLFESVKDFIDKGMRVININCIFEEGWTPKEARTEYDQLIKLADYLLENDMEHLYIAIFTERQEGPLPESNNSCFCFKGDTLVTTPNGTKKIADLNVGDEVYTASSSIHRVSKINSYQSDDNVELRVNGAFPIDCTSDHRVFAKKVHKNGKSFGKPDFYPVSELKRGDMVALPILRFTTRNEQSLHMNSAMARAIAVYLQYGYIDDNGDVIIAIKGRKKRYKYILEYALLEFEESKHNKQRVYRISKFAKNEKSETANKFFVNVCRDSGYRSIDKHIPKEIFISKRSIIRDVINELCQFDIDPNKNTFTFKSSRLANDVAILLRSFGYSVSCHVRAIDRKVYNVNIVDGSKFMSDDEYSVQWGEVKSIMNTVPFTVYCPTLEHIIHDEHTFIANGVAVENCGGNGSMLAVRPNGQFYPCIRYMPSSVGDNVKDLCIGTIDEGIIGREQGSEVLKMLDAITRRSQNTDICYECPIANSCASCLALGHDVFGDPGKRTTFTCIMVIAQALANVYYWNMMSLKHPEWDMPVRKNMVPDEWAKLVIDEEELERLKFIECMAIQQKIINKQ